ncbi:MAG: hypothetical protein AAFX93_13700 [Verrucomicrobiota bacterium]
MADVYFLLGAEGAGRRDAVRDLIEGGLEEDEHALIALHTSEPDTSADEQFLGRTNNRVVSYEHLAGIEANDVDVIFIVAPGRGNPLDAIDDFQSWIRRSGHTLARIITVVHCSLLQANPKLQIWHDACIHFSDVVLLNRRNDVPNKWFSDFRAHFEQEHFPCLIELMKKGRVRNPALILEPQPRRVSLAFDDDIEAVDLIEFDEDNLPEEPVDLVKPADPWLVRVANGQWERHLPEISKFL